VCPLHLFVTMMSLITFKLHAYCKVDYKIAAAEGTFIVIAIPSKAMRMHLPL
jgi:hypothetical protein